MTRKQFNWLRNNQPFEVEYVKLYDGTYVCGYHIRKATFKGEYIELVGSVRFWSKEANDVKEKTVHGKAHYKDIRKISYKKGECYKQYYNTEGNTKK